MSKPSPVAAEVVNPIRKRDRSLSPSDVLTGLEQYKLFVQMADNLSQRRQAANTFFLSISTALVGLIGIGSVAASDPGPPVLPILLSFAGLASTFAWFRFIQSYRKLSAAKFAVIHEMEHALPFRPYHAEWQALGRGEESRTYMPFTKIEAAVPWVFLATFAAILLTSIFWPSMRAALCGA